MNTQLTSGEQAAKDRMGEIFTLPELLKGFFLKSRHASDRGIAALLNDERGRDVPEFGPDEIKILIKGMDAAAKQKGIRYVRTSFVKVDRFLWELESKAYVTKHVAISLQTRQILQDVHSPASRL